MPLHSSLGLTGRLYLNNNNQKKCKFVITFGAKAGTQCRAVVGLTPMTIETKKQKWKCSPFTFKTAMIGIGASIRYKCWIEAETKLKLRNYQ